MALSLVLRSEGLRRLRNFPGELHFEVADCVYSCSQAQAAFASEKVARLLLSDPTMDRLKLRVTDENHIFDQVMSLINGECVTFSQEHGAFLTNVGLELENPELIEAGHRLEFGSEGISNENVVLRLKRKRDLSLGIDEEVGFLAAHVSEAAFESQYTSVFESLGLDLSSLVLSSPSLKLPDEDWLLDCILRKEFLRPLMSYVECEFLSEEGIAKFTSNVCLDDMNESLWSSICRRLHKKVDTRESDRFLGKPGSIPYTGSGLDGIINFLRKEKGGDPHSKGIVEVMASSIGSSYKPEKVFDYKWTEAFYTKDESNSWICVDFKETRTVLTHYTIRSQYYTAYCRPLHWVLEGSNTSNDSDWIELDSRNTDDLKPSLATVTYQLKQPSQPFRYFRIRQTGPNSCGGNHCLAITSLEFFGTVKTLKRY